MLENVGDDYSPEKLTRRANHIAKSLERFWKWWKLEYLLELREFHRRREATLALQPGELVTVYDESHPRGMCRLGRIEELPGTDEGVRGV